jgi:hydrogenase large subunit
MAAVKQRVADSSDSGQLGPFAHGYWGPSGHEAPAGDQPHRGLHYLQALEYQRYSNQVVAMLGGKTPHIQNVAVGGVANAINSRAKARSTSTASIQMKSLLEKIVSFVQNVYVPTSAPSPASTRLVLVRRRRDQLPLRPDLPLDGKNTQFELPAASSPTATSPSSSPSPDRKTRWWRKAVTEDSEHAWYKGGVRCIRGKARPSPHYTDVAEDGRILVGQGAAIRRTAAQVGPLANVLVGYASDIQLMKKWTDAALRRSPRSRTCRPRRRCSLHPRPPRRARHAHAVLSELP